MKYQQIKTFDLTKTHPNVLVLGNGLTRKTGIPWTTLIESIKRGGINIDPYKELDADGHFIRYTIPNTILTAATSIIDDKERNDKYTDIFNRIAILPNTNLAKLLSLNFDAILTTNYSYELESEIFSKYPLLSADQKRNYAAITKPKNKQDAQFLLHTFNKWDDKPDIWHIHGELRRPSSIVLTHDEYAKHTQLIAQYHSQRKSEYSKKASALKFRSWVDYFLLGNVYILGLTMDYSEFDLWWLLDRRQQEKAGKGEMIFYEAEKSGDEAKEIETKHHALQDVGITVNTLGMKTNTSADYEMFYQKAIEDIEVRITPKTII